MNGLKNTISYKEENMQQLITNVLIAITVAMIGIITRQLLPYLIQKKEEAIARIRRTRWAWAAEIIEAAVRAVEQTVADGVHGDDKKRIAFEYIKSAFFKSGIELTDAQIDTLIEAAVYAMNEGISELYVPAQEITDGILESSTEINS